MKIKLVLRGLLVFFICGCGQPEDPSVQAPLVVVKDRTALLQKAERIEFLESMLYGDDRLRKHHASYVEMPDADIEKTIDTLDAMLELLEESAHRSPLSDEERRIALEGLAKHSFEVDPRITSADVDAIINTIRKYECIDPRIMRITFVNENSLELSCGFVKGPVNGAGTDYVVHRRNGVWHITYPSRWIS